MGKFAEFCKGTLSWAFFLLLLISEGGSRNHRVAVRVHALRRRRNTDTQH
jgi:hypothetical protein